MPAFIGAQGGGSGCTHGRTATGQSEIVLVDSTSDGAGADTDGNRTIRWAINNGARFILFKVGGRITASTVMTFSNCYVAGQTAPGDGIAITASNTAIDDLVGASSGTCLRHIRLRTGLESNAVKRDTLRIGGTGIIVDHCSMSWGSDENIEMRSGDGVTVQWCISSEGLQGALEGSESKGMFAGGAAQWTNFSGHHCYICHNSGRNPLFAARTSAGAQAEAIQNVIMSINGKGENQGNFGATSSTWIGNVWRQHNLSLNQGFGGVRVVVNTFPLAVYVQDNYDANRTSQAQAETVIVVEDAPYTLLGSPVSIPAEVAISFGLIHDEATNVVTGAGASKPKYDAVDVRLRDYWFNSSSTFVNGANPNVSYSYPDNPGGWGPVPRRETEVGGFPAYNDPDNDGSGSDLITSGTNKGMRNEFVSRVGPSGGSLGTSISVARGLSEPYLNLEWDLMEQAGDIDPLPGSGPDTTPPTVPLNVLAIAQSATTIAVSWDPSTDLGGGVVDHYNVFRPSPTQITTISHPTVSFLDGGLTPSTEYTYQVSAVDDSNNESAVSASASATTDAPEPSPDITITTVM